MKKSLVSLIFTVLLVFTGCKSTFAGDVPVQSASVTPTVQESVIQPSNTIEQETEIPAQLIDRITVTIPECSAKFTLEKTESLYQKSYRETDNTVHYIFYFFDSLGRVTCDSPADITWYETRISEKPDDNSLAALSFSGSWVLEYPEEWSDNEAQQMRVYTITIIDDGLTNTNGLYKGSISFYFMQGFGNPTGDNNYQISDIAFE